MAIDPNIKQKAADIRTKVFGSEVRESLASGLEGMSEDVESIKGRQGNVESQFQNVIDETTGKDVISAPELIAARNGKSNLKTRLDDEHAQVTAQLQQTEQDLNSQLAETANKEDVANYYYKPTISMPALDETEGINAETVKSADVYALYEELKSNHPDYFKNITLFGNDQSGTLPIYWYDFKPTNYSDTIILGGNLHGPGISGDPKDSAIALYLFIKDLCENWNKNEALFQLRWNTRIIVMPIQNPWGFDNDTRQNSSGVDLNRNFDWKWEEYVGGTNPFDHDYKGTAPFSEVETQYIKAVLESFDYAVAYIDFHAFGSGTEREFVYPFYTSNDSSPLSETGKKITDFLSHKYNVGTSIQTNSTNPSAYNYAEGVIGIASCNPEYVVYATNFQKRTSEATNRMVEYYGNFIWHHIQLNSSAVSSSSSSDKYHHLWYKYGYTGNGGSMVVEVANIGAAGNGTVQEVSLLSKEIDVGITGYAKVTMRINARNTTGTASAQNFLVPIVYQYASPNFSESTPMLGYQDRWEAFWDGAMRFPLYMQAIIPVYADAGNLHIGIGGYVSEGKCQIYRYSAIVELVESNNIHTDDVKTNTLGWVNRFKS